MDRDAKFIADAVSEERAQLRGRLHRVETPYHDPRGQALAIPVDQRLGQWMRAIELCLAIRAHDEHRFSAQLPQQMSQEPQGSAIRPLQVIRVEKQTLVASQVCKYLRNGVEKKQPFFVRRQLRTLRKRPETRFNVGRKLRNLLGRVAQCDAQYRVILLLSHPASKCFYKRQVGSVRLILI